MGTFEDIGNLGIGIATVAIILVVAFIIMAQGKEQIADIEGVDLTNATQVATSAGLNATNTMANATQQIPGWVPLIVIAFIGMILITMVRKMY